MARRHLLLAGAPWLAILACRAVRAQPPTAVRPVSVLSHGADPSGATDSSSAFARAVSVSNSVLVPRGRYVIGDVRLRAGLSLQGEGDDSVLLQRRESRYALWCDSGSTDTRRNLRGLRISGLHLRGSSDVDGFSEHRHLLNLNGVTDCTVARTRFSAFRGDAIYLGSSNTAGVARHNLAVVIRGCQFDGVNHENRNAISVIDCDGLEIADCSFQRVSRDNMPGAIDIEPDAHDFHVVRNIRIHGNRFSAIGGNVAAVSLVVPAALAQPAENIIVEHNAFNGARRLAFCFLQRGQVKSEARPRGLDAIDNEISAPVDRAFQLEGVRQVTISGNRFASTDRCALVGYDAPALPVEDLVVADNRFDRCGVHDTCALRTYALRHAGFERNEWIDCGNGGPGAAAVELGNGDSGGLAFRQNVFAAPNGLMRYAIRRAPGHRPTTEANTFTDNRLAAGLLNQLPIAGAR